MRTGRKGFWSVGRLVIGIMMMVLAMVVLFQSCAVGMVNTLEGNENDAGGSAGLLVAILMVASGIIAVCTRNSESKAGAFVTAGLLLVGALLSFMNDGVFEDLLVWGIVCIAFAIVFIICGLETKKSECSGKE